ncbi:MAG TPA: efflux RND transporter permease subunit [Thermoanaerobaculia bacterium]|nr:efflux RND transporter permease subunit [Thermoanaerobaculia bacterium]
MSLARLAHHRGAAIFLVVAVLGAGGVFEALRSPASIFPAVTFPIVKVIADVGEEPASRVMPTSTRPLEEAVLRVPGVRRVLSATSRGSTEMSAEFTWGTDMQQALQRVQAEVERIRPDLPPDARVDVEWMNTSIFPILGYALTSDTESQASLWELAEYTLKPALIRIPGIGQVQIQGGRQREFQVRLDPAALAGRRLSARDVVDAIQKDNAVESAGLLESNHELYLSLVDGRARGIAELSALPIPLPGEGVPARLSDLGTVASGDAFSAVRTTADGRPAVLVNIVQQPSANTVAIARGVSDLLKNEPDLIPKGVRWTNFYDQAAFVSGSVGGARDAILIGVGLAVLVLFFFLRDWRLTAIAAATIPVCVAIVLLGLAVTGQTINLMTLGGIAAAIGLIADDAIVVVEDMQHGAHASGGELGADLGISRFLPPLLGSSLSTMVIFFPFALVTGITGAFFRPLALTMAMALGVSFLLSAIAVPAAVKAFGATKGRGKPPAQGGMPRLRRLVSVFVRRPVLALVAFVLLMAAAFVLWRVIGTDFLPAMDEGSIILDYWTPPGTSLTDTDQMLDAAETIIRKMPDVDAYSRRTGTQLGFFITEPNRGDYVIKLKPKKHRREVDEIIDELRGKIASAEPAIHTDFGQLLEDNIGDLTGGVPQPIDVKIFGADENLLEEKARRAARIIGGVHGVEDVFDGITIAGPALSIRPKAAVLARSAMTTDDLHAAVEPALTGTVASDLLIGDRVYPVRVFTRRDGPLTAVPVRTGSGAIVPLSDLATIETGAPEAEIDRENLKSYFGVTGRLTGRSLGDAVAEIQRKLRSGLALPPGMTLAYGGQYEQQQSSFKALVGVLLGGLLLVGVVLLFEFGDWRAPLLTGLVSLSVLAGVFALLLATGMTLNISSFVGAIMMVGIVGEKSVFFIHDAREELRRGYAKEEAWARAAERRFRAVAMTTLATVFALLPLSLALGAGAQLLQPLAIAVIGGFIFSGLIVLLVLPALYAWLDPHGRLAGDLPSTRRSSAP